MTWGHLFTLWVGIGEAMAAMAWTYKNRPDLIGVALLIGGLGLMIIAFLGHISKNIHEMKEKYDQR